MPPAANASIRSGLKHNRTLSDADAVVKGKTLVPLSVLTVVYTAFACTKKNPARKAMLFDLFFLISL